MTVSQKGHVENVTYIPDFPRNLPKTLTVD